MEVRFVEGMRVSDAETVEVAKMVLLGKVNADIVMRLNRHGQPAVGLSGEDGALFAIEPHERAEEVGFVGEIEHVDVDVLNHIAADYIPVIASAGVDAEGRSYNINADTAAGKVAGGAGRVQGDLPHRRRRLARRPRGRVDAALAGLRRRGRGRARLGHRRHAAEARRLRRGGAVRGRLGAHHRRPAPALAAAGAVHGCGHRDDGHAMSVEELKALEGRYAMDTYARAPVEFVRGEGARLWDAEGREYLDFFAGLSRPQRRPLPPADRRGDHRAGGALCRQLQPLLHRSPRCGSASGWPSRASAGACSCATPAPRRARARSSWSASAPTPAGSTRPRSSPSTAPSTGARSGRSPRPRGSPAMTSSAPCRAASSRSRATIRPPCAPRSTSARRR